MNRNRLSLVRPYSDQAHIEPIGPLLPSIHMTWEVYRDTTHLIALTRDLGKEISWVGKVHVQRQENAEVYVIAEIRVLPQESTAVETRLDPIAVAQVAREWIRASGTEQNPCRFWGHTHVHIGPDPSPKDDQQMLSFIREGGPPFFIRGIFSPLMSGTASGPYLGPRSDPADLGHADFTLYDYRKGVLIRHVPWFIVDTERSTELAAIVDRALAPTSNAAPATATLPTGSLPPAPDGAPGAPAAVTTDQQPRPIRRRTRR